MIFWLKKKFCNLFGHTFKYNKIIGWYCSRCNNYAIIDTLQHEIKAEIQLNYIIKKLR